MSGFESDMNVEHWITAVKSMSVEELRALVASLSEPTRNELLLKVTQNPQSTPVTAPSFVRVAPMTAVDESGGLVNVQRDGSRFECAVCFKKFKRKWNCERHFQKKHTPSNAKRCEFSDCSEVFGSADGLAQHLTAAHGLDMAVAGSKKAKVGVVHEDHYDLLLPSGVLLHMGEQGVEQRRLEPTQQHGRGGQDQGEQAHIGMHPRGGGGGGGSGGGGGGGGGGGLPVVHGDHFGMWADNVLNHADEAEPAGNAAVPPQPSRAHYDLINIPPFTEWDEFFNP